MKLIIDNELYKNEIVAGKFEGILEIDDIQIKVEAIKQPFWDGSMAEKPIMKSKIQFEVTENVEKVLNAFDKYITRVKFNDVKLKYSTIIDYCNTGDEVTTKIILIQV